MRWLIFVTGTMLWMGCTPTDCPEGFYKNDDELCLEGSPDDWANTESNFDDPRDYIDDEFCDDFQPSDIDETLPNDYTYIATSVWTGDFTIDAEGIVTGTEELSWSPKPEWEADPNVLVAQTACTVVYNVDGTSADSTQCTACDYAIEATAFRDESASTCPLDVLQELVPDTYELEYHVRIGDNNAADVYFPSMNLMDGPYAMANDQFFVFTTPPACWFH